MLCTCTSWQSMESTRLYYNPRDKFSQSFHLSKFVDRIKPLLRVSLSTTMTVLQLHASDGNQLNGKGSYEQVTKSPKKHETAFGDPRSCLFPDLDATSEFDGRWQSTEVLFRDVALLDSFCQEHGVSSFAVLQLAWAVILRCYLGSESVSFNYTVLGEETVMNHHGTYPSVNACCVDFEGMGSLLDLLRVIQADLHSRNQALCLDTDGQTSKGDPRLFDTAMLYQVKQQDSIANVFPNGVGQGSGKVVTLDLSRFQR